MKHISTCILLLVLFSLPARSQQTAWQWVNPLPQGNLLNGLWAVSQDTVLGVGTFGTVIRTTNGGTTWQVEQAVAGIIDQLFAVQFKTSTLGWAVGEAGRVLKSTDAGASWATLNISTLRDLYAVNFVSSTTGWVAGAFGVIFKTTDGGTTWSAESSGTSNTLYSVNFFNSSTGWAVGASGTILKTTNGGASWTTQTSGTTQSLYSTQFLSTSVGWTSGAFGTMLRTVNGGTSWTSQTTGSIFSLYALQFNSFLTGWAVGAYGEVVKSTNGGINWFEQSSGTYNDLYGAQFISASVGWAMGDLGTIVKTTDGGSTWIGQSNGVKNTLNGIYFPSTNTGYSVGEQGTIIRSTDGGVNWLQQSSGTYQTLYGTFFVSPSIGWAVGDSASILKTTNSGITWAEEHSHTDPSLYSIYFANASAGWTVGDFGTILATANGGTTWVAETSHTTTTLLAVKFFDALSGWAVGYGGTILKSTNGGTTWASQTSGTTRTLYCIEARSATNVYMSGDFGLVLHTTNGGTTWTPMTTGTDVSLYSLSFYSNTMGWGVGDDGTIIRTTDAGNTWQSQTSGTDHTLWGVQVVPGSTGAVVFATGIGGTIICSGVSPLPGKTWTGSFDSLWTTAANWTPIGVPEKIDSIIIPPTATSPILRGTIQQIDIASLRIKPGAKLTIRNGIAQFIVKDDLSVDGTLTVDADATTEIITGGNFFRGVGSTFNPGNSTVVFNGPGQLSGNFYKLVFRESASMQSVGTITVGNSIILMSDLNLRPFDTLIVLNRDAQSFQGPGIISAGTVRRAIQQGSLDQYRFESPATYFEFYPTGVYPDTMIVTAFVHTLPPGLPDSLFVRRYYTIAARGGSNFLGFMSLRYDTSETAISIDNLSLFRDSSGILFNMGKADFLDSDIVAISLDSVTKFSTWYIGRSDYFPMHPLQFTDSLIVSDNGSLRDTLAFGAIPGARDTIDVALGETVLGPKPPTGFDARWRIPPTNGTATDLRDILSITHQQNVYTLALQPGPGGYPFTLSWNVAALPAGTFFLRDSATHGGVINVNMKSQPTYLLSNSSINRLEIVHIAPQYYNFNNSWNMVSLPLNTTTDGRKIHLFPTAISSAFWYNNGYQIIDTLKNGRAYWIKFAAAQQIPIDGLARVLDTIIVNDGWNMIGSISNPVAVANIQKIPGNVVGQNFFGYNGSYTITDSIRPSKGYWVKASGNGKLVLSSSGAAPEQPSKVSASADLLNRLNRLTVAERSGSSQTLYFGKAPDPAFTAEEYDLPPPAPDGLFDARFASGRMAEVSSAARQSYVIQLQASSYPIRVSWKIRQSDIRAITLRDPQSGQVFHTSPDGGSGSVQLWDPSLHRLELVVDASAPMPKEFALHQNFPNPFNPTTTIIFDLPADARVSVNVFNILGQEVSAPIENTSLGAGTHSVTLNGENLSSGIYFYRVIARASDRREYHEIRKMVLLK